MIPFILLQGVDITFVDHVDNQTTFCGFSPNLENSDFMLDIIIVVSPILALHFFLYANSCLLAVIFLNNWYITAYQ